MGVLTNGLEEPVSGEVVCSIQLHEAFVHQPDNKIDHVEGVEIAFRADLFSDLQIEPTDEHGQAPEDGALRSAQQVIGPVDKGAERLLARKSSPRPTRE